MSARAPGRPARPRLPGRAAGLLLAVAVAAPPVHGADTERGRALYAAHCATCHGPNGVPIMPGAPDFTRANALMKPDPMLMMGIKLGRNAMPAYNGLLKDREILDVIAYLRTLK